MSAEPSATLNTSKRPSRGLKVALFASLALNFLIIGGLISAYWRHGGPLIGSAQIGQVNLGQFVQTLPKDRGSAIWRSTSEKRRAMMPLRQQVRQSRREALAALTADPFDHEAFRSAQTRLIEAENRTRLAQRDILVDLAGSMTVEERRAYIRWRGPPRPNTFDEDEHSQQPKK